MISELDRLIELGWLIGRNTKGKVNVRINVDTYSVWGDSRLEVWIFFFDENEKITAHYCYNNSPNVLNILTMMFNESREK